jgi:hypothetical protein
MTFSDYPGEFIFGKPLKGTVMIQLMAVAISS